MTLNRTLVGPLSPEDYGEIQEGVAAIKRAVDFLSQHHVRVDVQHFHRLWEYGSAVQALLSVYQENMTDLDVLDVGAGHGALGPALALQYNLQVTECDPDPSAVATREHCNRLLTSASRKPIRALTCDVHHLPAKQYDAVFCISVLEHVEKESTAWKELAKRVKTNGLLFVTVDCVQERGKHYANDEYRVHNFTPSDMQERVGILQDLGFCPMGKPSYEWRGAQVFDYTFFRAGMMHLNGIGA